MSSFYKTLILFFLSLNILKSQVTEGQFMLSISAEKLPSSEVDDDTFNMIKTSIEGSRRIYFDEDYFVIEHDERNSESELTSETRLVYRIRHNDIYTFTYYMDAPICVYSTDIEGFEGDGIVDIRGKRLSNSNYLGLDCKILEEKDEISMKKFWITDYFKLPVAQYDGLLLEDGQMIIRSEIINDGVKVVLHLHDYKPLKDKSPFRIDTISVNQIFHLEDLELLLNDTEESVIGKKEYRLNEDLLKKILADEITSNNSNIQYLLDDKEEKHDKAYILGKLLDFDFYSNPTKNKLLNLTRTQLFQKLKEFGFGSETVVKLFNDDSIPWKKMTNKERSQLIERAYLLDYLGMKEVRASIVDNLRNSRFPYQNENFEMNAEKYVEGKSDFHDFLCSYTDIYRMEGGTHKSDVAVKKVEKLVSELTKGTGAKITKSTESILIKTTKGDVEINLANYKNDEGDVILDFYFYENFVDRLIQIYINTDFNKGFQWGEAHEYKANSFHRLSELDEYYYDYIPDYLITRDDEYIIEILDGNQDGYSDLPLIAEYDESMLYSSLAYRLGGRYKKSPFNLLGKSVYISSNTKEEFIRFLKKNKNSFKLDDNGIQIIKEDIQGKLIDQPNYMLQWIPDVRFSTGYGNPFTIDFIRENFNRGYKTIEYIFPNIYKVVGDDFLGKNLRLENEELVFEVSGITHRIEPNEFAMAKFMKTEQPFVNKNKKIVNSFSIPIDRDFFYLTIEQINDINRILGTGF